MRSYLRLSGVLFALLALGHLIRLVWRWPLAIAGRPLPGFFSLLALLISGGMSAWAFKLLAAYKGSD